MSNQPINSVSISNGINVDVETCNNTILLLHAAIASLNRTLSESLSISMKEEPEDKIRLSKAYRKLASHHTYNSILSGGTIVAGASQIALTGYGYSPNTAKAVSKMAQSGVASMKEYNQGNIQALDSQAIELAKKESESRQENMRRVQNVQERAQETANSAISRIVESYDIRA